MTKIYTKKGDTGKTTFFNNTQVSKSSVYIESVGSLDETTSYIGWAREQVENDDERQFLSQIQHDLYVLMGALMGATCETETLQSRIAEMESRIDAMTKKLPKITYFLLPQGSEASTRLHIARTTVRNAERRVVAVQDADQNHPKSIAITIQYLNRLSDYFFTLARLYAHSEKRA